MKTFYRIVAVFLFVSGCSQTDREGSEIFTHFQEIESPASSQSGQPFLSSGSDGVIYLSWIEPGMDKKHAFRLSRLEDNTWKEPTTIIEGDEFFVNWADVPSVFQSKDGIFAAHWLQSSAEWVYAYDIQMSISGDSGLTWSEPLTPHRDGTKTEHGFASFFNHPDGGFGVVWLDGREAKANITAEGHHAHSTDANAETDDWNMHLRSAYIRNDGSIGTELLLDGRVCECCPTAATETGNGIIVAYRNRSPDEIRDIFLVRYEDGTWSDPYPVHNDGWNIAGCPVNGPALASIGDYVAIAWYTAANDEARVYIAFSSDGGRSFTAPYIVNDGIALGRIAVDLLDDRSAFVLWIEVTEENAGLMVRRIFADGTAGNPEKIATVSDDRFSGYPRMVRNDDTVIFAWVDTFGESIVKTAIATLAN
jgi:hypothetical protein